MVSDNYHNPPIAFSMTLDTDVQLTVTLRRSMADAEHEALFSLTNADGQTVVAPMTEAELVLLAHRIQYLLGGFGDYDPTDFT